MKIKNWRLKINKQGFTQHHFNRSKNGAGFTLIELMVVVAIVAMLLSFATILYSSAREKGRDARRKNDIKQIQNALALYQVNERQFPMCDPREIIDNSLMNCLRPLVGEGTIPALPIDPLNRGACVAGFVYCYFSVDGSSYTLGYGLETDAAGWQTIGP